VHQKQFYNLQHSAKVTAVLHATTSHIWAALSYWAGKYDSATAKCPKNGHFAAANSWIVPSCSV